jgi:hypothetical protein
MGASSRRATKRYGHIIERVKDHLAGVISSPGAVTGAPDQVTSYGAGEWARTTDLRFTNKLIGDGSASVNTGHPRISIVLRASILSPLLPLFAASLLDLPLSLTPI